MISRYQENLEQFLAFCGELTPEERVEAIETYDRSLTAAGARLADAWFDLVSPFMQPLAETLTRLFNFFDHK